MYVGNRSHEGVVEWMRNKSDLLVKVALDLVEKANAQGLKFVICGGIAIHIMYEHCGMQSQRPWNHKDIDLVVPLSQLPLAFGFSQTNRV